MKIAVIGTGYVGLVTGTCLAETGNNITCVDIVEEKIEKMKAGGLPIYEPGLDILFHRNIAQGRLTFTTNLAEAIKDATIIFLALPTPPGGDGKADLSYVLGAAKDIANLITIAAKVNMTYEEVNVWIFVIIEPIVFFIMLWIIYRQYLVIKSLKQTLLP